MHRLVGGAVALAVAPVLVGTALLVLAHPWVADAAYALPGFPDPRIEMGDGERSRLAAVSTHAIQPWRGDGLEEMRAARRDDGRPAFDAAELRHFADVRDLVAAFLIAALAGAVVVGVAALAGARSTIRRGLALGARVTLGLLAVLSVLMLVGFDAFFEAFHGVFFEGESWKLPRFGTVRSLYPDAFWGLMGGVTAVLVIGQAAALALALRRTRSTPR